MLEREMPGIQSRAGWNDYTLLGLLFDFLEEKSLENEVLKFVAQKADEEVDLNEFLSTPIDLDEGFDIEDELGDREFEKDDL